MKQFSKRPVLFIAVFLVAVLAIAAGAVASDVDVAVVDVAVPTNSVTLAPGESATITINMTVTGNQDGTATFEVYRDWTLSGGAFVGSNSQEFTVGPRHAQDPPTTFSTSGTVTVAPGQAAGTFTLAAGAFDITNSNQTGAKLRARSKSNYQVTVEIAAPTDTAAPTTSHSLSGTAGNNGWYVSDVKVTLTANDNEGGSGVKETKYRVNSGGWAAYSEPFTVSDEGENLIQYYSEDNAGNVEEAKSVTIKIDKTPPTISGAPDCEPNENGWYKADVTVSYTVGDAVSGIDDNASDYAPDVLGEGADQSATGYVYDLAGNYAEDTVSGINIDKTAPTVAFDSIAGPIYLNATAWATWKATDNLSGIDGDDTGTVPLDTSSVGSKSGVPSPPVCDKAGNHAETKHSDDYKVVYKTVGDFFLAPLNTRAPWSLFKAGSTIPVKFQLLDASGNPVPGATARISFSKSGDNPPPEGELEVAYSTSAATTGNLFRYDPVAGQYIFNWGTKKVAIGTWFIWVWVDDGDWHGIQIGLK
jgi:hypothetical protein